jgi:hypothetical protein
MLHSATVSRLQLLPPLFSSPTCVARHLITRVFHAFDPRIEPGQSSSGAATACAFCRLTFVLIVVIVLEEMSIGPLSFESRLSSER